jgi:hypothetical protein
MAVVAGNASFIGRGSLSGPWPAAPLIAVNSLPGVPGNPQPFKAYGQVSGISCDPAWAFPGPSADSTVSALNKTGYLASLVLPGAH